MIKEAYVSFEVAKLLKEKGFNEKCRGGYHYEFDDNDNSIIMFEQWTAQPYNNDFMDEGFSCSAPTHQMAMAWLREIHHYYIQIMLDSWACGDHLGYYVVIQKTDSDFEMMLQDAVNEVFYQTYEEAVEAALKYVLKNLI